MAAAQRKKRRTGENCESQVSNEPCNTFSVFVRWLLIFHVLENSLTSCRKVATVNHFALRKTIELVFNFAFGAKCSPKKQELKNCRAEVLL